MLVKVQLLKGAVCVGFYLVACVVFIKIRKNFDSKEVTDVITTNYQPITFGFSSANKINKKNVELEMLRIDELKGETIDYQVYLKVPQRFIFIDIRDYQVEKNKIQNWISKTTDIIRATIFSLIGECRSTSTSVEHMCEVQSEEDTFH